MAISSVQIANFALSKVGTDSTIESLTETSSEAKEANLWFSFVREEVLAAFNWQFARKRILLAAHTEDPPDEWAYRYIYPSESLKARFIENPVGLEADPVPFIVELAADDTKSLLTNQGTATLIYTSSITDTTLYTPWFIESFATMLAAKICFPITGKLNLSQNLETKARQMLIVAPAMDAQEKQDPPPRDGEATRARA